MQKLKRMPKSGQFVAIWMHNGEPWSNTYKWFGKDMFVLDYNTDKWVEEQAQYFEDGTVFYRKKVVKE